MGLKHSHTSANRAIAYKAIVTNTNVTFLVSEVSCTALASQRGFCVQSKVSVPKILSSFSSVLEDEILISKINKFNVSRNCLD